MRLLSGKRRNVPKLDRRQAMEAIPVLSQLISVDHKADGTAVLDLPRKRTSMVRAVSTFFRLPPYKRIELDELGSYAVELCDGTNTVSDIIAQFAKRFQLHRREAEVSMLTYLKSLAKRGIIGFAVPDEQAP